MWQWKNPCTQKTDSVRDSTTKIKRVLDAKYEKADLDEVVCSNQHLTQEEWVKLKGLLYKYESLFDGNLGSWLGEDVHIELKDNI